MIYDPTLEQRRRRAAEINAEPKSRRELEAIWGPVWNHLEVRREFSHFFFANPVLVCFEKKTGRQGTFLFQHSPRFYFHWLPLTSEAE